MGRSVESGSDSLLDIGMYWEEGHVSMCANCEADVKISGYGYDGPEWELAYPKEGVTGEDLALCVTDPAENDYDDGEKHKGWEYDSDNWQNDLEFYQERLIEMFPSLTAENDWNPSNYFLRESRVIARNALVEVRVSEYSGVTNLSFAPVDYNGETSTHGLAKRWVEQIAPKVEAWRG